MGKNFNPGSNGSGLLRIKYLQKKNNAVETAPETIGDINHEPTAKN